MQNNESILSDSEEFEANSFILPWIPEVLLNDEHGSEYLRKIHHKLDYLPLFAKHSLLQNELDKTRQNCLTPSERIG